MEKLDKLNLKCYPRSIGALPSSYLVSLSYEEQLLLLCKKQEEVIEFINDVLEQKINDYITERFNDLMINAMYEEETETLVLYLDTQGGE